MYYFNKKFSIIAHSYKFVAVGYFGDILKCCCKYAFIPYVSNEAIDLLYALTSDFENDFAFKAFCQNIKIKPESDLSL